MALRSRSKINSHSGFQIMVRFDCLNITKAEVITGYFDVFVRFKQTKMAVSWKIRMWSYFWAATKLKAKSFTGKKIGVIQDYTFAEIEDYLQANKNTLSVQYVRGAFPLETNLKKLIGKRFDITIDDGVVVNYTAKEMGIEKEIKSAGNLSAKNNIVIGFSSNNPKSSEYARILSEGIDALRKSGELDKILSKYDIKDWK